eukprot:3066961-Amphidinium_carterae.1
MARVIFRACSRPAGTEFVAEALRMAQTDEGCSSPLWLSWLSWVRSFGGVIVDGNITLQGKVVLHHGLSLSAWKHEVRRLLSLSAIALTQKAGRHLQDLELEKWDTYIAHHVIVPGAESHGTETFSSGGVNCRERIARSSGSCPSTCEIPGCNMEDTPAHRTLFCPSLSGGSRIGWTAEDTHRVVQQSHFCSHFCFWQVPSSWVRDLTCAAPSVVDFERLSKIGRGLRTVRNLGTWLRPRLDFWVTMLPAKHKGASAAVVSHLFSFGSFVAQKTLLIRDAITQADLEWLSHVFALCLVSLIGCELTHSGVFRLANWSGRDHSRTDYWNSLRNQLDLSMDALLSETENALPPPQAHCDLVRSTEQNHSRAILLDNHSCASRQYCIMNHVL